MNNIKTPPKDDVLLKHLPHYSALLEYDSTEWVAFGTLTHRYPTSPKTQFDRFTSLMDEIGGLNGSYGRRLHWMARIEMGKLGKLAEHGKREPQWHLHFVLAAHKVTDAHRHTMTSTEACRFLDAKWKHGKSEVVPYDQNLDGIGYILKCPAGPNSDGWNDRVEISPSLLTYLKNRKTIDGFAGRDSLAVQILLGLRGVGAKVWFGDEVPHWRAA